METNTPYIDAWKTQQEHYACNKKQNKQNNQKTPVIILMSKPEK